MALTFPYPKIGTVNRGAGEGCKTCVHQLYCEAYYWWRRRVQKEADDYTGVACESWSNNEADRIRDWTEEDYEENDYLNDQGILREPNGNAMTDPTTGDAHRPF